MNVNPAHRDHDELLLARVASGDADEIDRAAADRQLAACQDCRTLLADVLAIHAATTGDVLRVPSRPRSFRIAADQLERLRTPAWRRWLARFGAPRFDLVRPLATAVAGLGLAVFVIGSVQVSLPSFGFAAAGAPETATPAPAAQIPGSETAVPTPPLVPSSAEDRNYGGVAASPAPGSLRGAEKYPQPTEPATTLDQSRGLAASGEQRIPLVPLGVVFLVVGVAVIVLNTTARRAAGR